MPSPRCLAACYPHEKGWRVVLDERTNGRLGVARNYEGYDNDNYDETLSLPLYLPIIPNLIPFPCCPPYLFLFPLSMPLLHFSLALSILQLFSLCLSLSIIYLSLTPSLFFFPCLFVRPSSLQISALTHPLSSHHESDVHYGNAKWTNGMCKRARLQVAVVARIGTRFFLPPPNGTTLRYSACVYIRTLSF